MNNPKTDELRQAAEQGDLSALYELGIVYLSSGNQQDRDEAKNLLVQAATEDHVESQILLGDIYIRNLCAPASNYEDGARWYQVAAEQGSSKAQARLGSLYFSGIGVPQDDAQVFYWYRKAAEHGSPEALCNLAYLYSNGIGIDFDEGKATTEYLKAAIDGEPRAYHNLGLRYAEGTGATQNYIHACAFLKHAAISHYPGSETTLGNLLMMLTEKQVEDYVALADKLVDYLQQQSYPAFSLDTATRCKDTTANEMETCATPCIEVISWKPRVFKIHNFLQQHECDHLIELALRHKGESEASIDAVGGQSLNASFSGHTALFDLSLYDPVLCLIERRIASATLIPADHGEWLSILGYSGGEDYAPHVDFFVTEEKTGEMAYKHVGQRLITFLMYLSEVEEGGETVYPQAGIQVVPEKGMAIMHCNCLPGGHVDPMTVHASLPVKKGVKWLARKAICERSFYKQN